MDLSRRQFFKGMGALVGAAGVHHFLKTGVAHGAEKRTAGRKACWVCGPGFVRR